MKLEWHDFKRMGMWIIVDRLADVILSHVEGCIVEIGIGKSTKVLAKHAQNFGIKHYAIDKCPNKCRWANTNEGIAHDGLIICHEESLDFLKNFEDIPAIVFIDGCHHYEVVKEEVAILLPKIPEGGVMFLHDTFMCKEVYELITKHRKYIKNGWFSDCYKVRLDLEKDDSVWCMTFPYSAWGCGLTLVLKKPKFEYSCDSPRGTHL